MSIIRSPRPKGNFTVIANDVLRDGRLSYRARGLLAAILSRPDDWRTSADSLAREGREGRDAILTALRELEDHGYLERIVTRCKTTGRISQHSVVYDKPTTGVEKPEAGKPASGEPEPETSTDLERPEKKQLDKTAPAKREPGPADAIAKTWWSEQNPKPAGKGAWFSLRNAVQAVVDAGWSEDRILGALRRINSVPSVAQLDRELRSPRLETWMERKAREERDELEAIARRREQERQANLERERQRAAEAAQAVPPPPEFREAVARLRGRPA